MVGDGCPCGCGLNTTYAELDGHDFECPTACGPSQIAVRVSNSYACGRRSGWVQILTAPPPSISTDALEDWLLDHVITGDGHPCGAHEIARYETDIVAAGERQDLVGRIDGWEG